MCKYCERREPFNSLTIIGRPLDLAEYVIIAEGQMHILDMSGMPIDRIPIRFCPMCGGKVRTDQSRIIIDGEKISASVADSRMIMDGEGIRTAQHGHSGAAGGRSFEPAEQRKSI